MEDEEDVTDINVSSSVQPEEQPPRPLSFSQEEQNLLAGDRSFASQGAFIDPEDVVKPLSFTEAVGTGTDHWVTSAYQRSKESANAADEIKIDTWTPELYKKYTAGLGESQGEWVTKATSIGEAEWRYKYAKDKQDVYQRLVKGGWTNILASAFVEAFDPVEIAAITGATWGAGTIPRTIAGFTQVINKAMDAQQIGKRVYRSMEQASAAQNVLRRAATGAGFTAATLAPFEAYRISQNPMYNEDDFWTVMMFAGGLGGLANGGAGYWRKMEHLKSFQDRMKTGKPLTEAEEKYYATLVDPNLFLKQVEKVNKAADDLAEKKAAKPDGEFDPMVDRAVEDGLNKPTMSIKNREAYDDAPTQLRAPSWLSFGLSDRVSSISRIMKSDDPYIRELGGALTLNSSGRSDRSVVRMDAETIGRQMQNQSTIDFIIPLNDAKRKWEKINRQPAGVNPMERMLDDDEYFQAVAKAVRRGGSDDPYIMAGVRAWQAETEKFAKRAKEANVRGSDKFEHDPNHVPRDYHDAKLDEFRQKYGDDELIDMLEGAIKAKQVDIEPSLARMIAEGMTAGLFKRLTGRITGDMPTVHMGYGTDEYNIMLQGLIPKIGEQQANKAVKELKAQFGVRANDEDGVFARLRHRVDLDETYVHKTKNGDLVHFDDLLENNIHNLHQNYTFQMGNAIGLARNGIDLVGQETFDATLTSLKNEMAKMTDRKLIEKRKKEIDALEFNYDSLTGRLAHQTGLSEKGEDMLRRIRDYNFIRSMGASGIPTTVELGSLIFEHTAKGIWDALPHLRKMTAKLADGDLSDPLSRELMHLFGSGTDMYTGHIRNYFDDLETDLVRPRYKKADAVLAKGRQFTAVGSGMLPLTAMFRRSDTLFFAYDWYNVAKKGMHKKHGRQPYADIKMEQLGITAENADKILKQINKHAQVDGNGNLVTLNTKNWDDQVAKEIFALAGYRHSNQIIQETSMGSVNRLIRSPWGKTVGQFLSYVLAAQEQQFQRNFAKFMHGDKVAASRILAAGSFMSMMAYIAGVHYRSMGMSEERRKKYLKTRLSPDRMFTDGVIGYSGFFAFQSTILQRIREANLIGNPSVDFLKTVSEFASVMGKDALGDDKDMTEAQVSRFLQILPTSLYPLAFARNSLADQLANQ